MTLGFDAKKAIRNHTGIGNYSRRCIQSVRAAGHDVRTFYCGTPLLGELWRNCLQWLSVRRSQVDVYHGLSNELPLGIHWSGARSVVTIHDLIFLRYPSTYSWSQRHILRWKTRYACRMADRIVAVSEQTKRDIITFYGIEPSRIVVIYQSIDDAYRQPCDAAWQADLRERYCLPDCFILCVGTIQTRKNQHTLVEALQLLPEDVHLVLVGKEEAYGAVVRQRAHELGVDRRVHIFQGVPTTDLPAFYRLASVFAYPSRYEGFGIPVVEALASGTPVIAATGSCLEEAGGPDSIYLAPDDVHGLADAVTQLLAHPERRQHMIERGQAYAQRFTDQQLATDLIHLYQDFVS